MKTKRAYRFRFYPDPQQEKLLARTFGCVRFVYNSILRYRTDTYAQTQEKIGYTAANARLTAIKKLPEFAPLLRISFGIVGSFLDGPLARSNTSLRMLSM